MKPVRLKAAASFSAALFALVLLCAPGAAGLPAVAYAADGAGQVSSPSTSAAATQRPVAYTGQGSSASPIKIADAQGLMDFAHDYNAGTFDSNKAGLFIVVTADIDLAGASWEPIGSSSERPFVSSFDAQGHRISGLSLNASPEGGLAERAYPYGVFGYVAQGSIRNLQVEGDIRLTGAGLGGGGAAGGGNSGGGATCVGLLAGAVLPSDAGTVVIDGCSVSGSLSVKNGDFYAGGLIGYIALSGAGHTVQVSESDSSVAVTAADARKASRIGGLVGFADAGAQDSSLTIRDCLASGPIAVSQATAAGSNAPAGTSATSAGVTVEAGGLMGALYIGQDSLAATLRKDATSGKVTVGGDLPYNSTGGMIGSLQVSGGTFSAESCSAAVEIEASGQSNVALAGGAPAGGAPAVTGSEDSLAGDAGTAPAQPTVRASFLGPKTAVGGLFGVVSVDRGSVALSSSSASGKGSSKGTMVTNDCGGLIGHLQAQAGASVAITASSASGAFEASGTEENAGGGLIGQAAVSQASSLAIATSHADGSAVTHNGSVCFSGGLVGKADFSGGSSLSVTRCSAGADALAGMDPGAQGNIFGLFTKPDSRIYTDYEVGGLIGSLTGSGGSAGLVSSCFASGKAVVQGSQENCVGGLAGSLYAGKGSQIVLESCYALGDVSASGEATYHDAGGLVGYACGDTGGILVETCYATGAVAISGETYRDSAGGIMGRADVIGAGAAEGVGGAGGVVGAGAGAGGAGAEAVAGAEGAGAAGAEGVAAATAGGPDADAAGPDAAGAGAAASDDDGAPAVAMPFDRAVAAGTVTLRNTVAANARIDAAEATNNSAGRIVGLTTQTNNGALVLEENIAWREMTVNGSTIEDAAGNGEGIVKSYLLDRSFWETRQSGSGFADGITWKTQDGFLPLLTYPSGSAYAPSYLVTQSVSSSAATHNANVSSVVFILLNCAFVALVIIAFIRLKRSLEDDEEEI